VTLSLPLVLGPGSLVEKEGDEEEREGNPLPTPARQRGIEREMACRGLNCKEYSQLGLTSATLFFLLQL
jgi:hypothetical protein